MYLITIFLFICLTTLSAQEVNIIWEQTYDAGEFEYASKVIEDSNSDLIICGTTYNTPSQYGDILLIKTDEVGNIIWQKIYGGDYDDIGVTVFQPNDSCYLIIGYTNSFKSDLNDYDIYLLKLDLDGDTLWTKLVGTDSTSEKIFSGIVTSDNNILAVGEDYSLTDFNQDMLLLKMAQDGNIIWKKTYGGVGYEKGQDVLETYENGFFIAGETSSFGIGTPFFSNIYLVRTDSTGDSLWTTYYGNIWYDYSRTIVKSNDNNYIVSGWFATNGAEVSDFYVTKIQDNGDTTWTRLYGGGGYEYCNDILMTDSNNFILFGNTNSYGEGSYDIYLVKINTNGDTIWTKTIGTYEYENATGALKTNDGKFIVHGNRRPFSMSNLSDILLVKLDINSLNGLTDYKNSIPSEFTIKQNYPNPFNNSTVFEIEIPDNSNLQLQIFDITGKKVFNYNFGNVNPSIKKVQWNGLSNSGTQVASGVYFYRFNFLYKKGKQFSQIKKMTFIK